jgi:archaellum biogenesis protein FlaJ (TadC family)
MLARLNAFCLYSLTIAWGYVLAIVGGIMSMIDNIGDALGDPNLKDQISAATGDAKTTGRILLGISVVTILARLRSLKKGA